MRDLVLLFAFMLIPVWIPMIGALCGAMADRLMPAQTSPASQAVAVARARAAEVQRRRPAMARADASRVPSRADVADESVAA